MPPVPPHHSLKQSLRFSSFFIYSHAVITPKWRDEILVLLTFIPQLNIFIVICPICPIFTSANTLKHTSAMPDGIFGSICVTIGDIQITQCCACISRWVWCASVAGNGQNYWKEGKRRLLWNYLTNWSPKLIYDYFIVTCHSMIQYDLV